MTKRENIATAVFCSVLQNPPLIAAIMQQSGAMTADSVNAALVKESLALTELFIKELDKTDTSILS